MTILLFRFLALASVGRLVTTICHMRLLLPCFQTVPSVVFHTPISVPLRLLPCGFLPLRLLHTLTDAALFLSLSCFARVGVHAWLLLVLQRTTVRRTRRSPPCKTLRIGQKEMVILHFIPYLSLTVASPPMDEAEVPTMYVQTPLQIE
ncbi:hypothetical protein EI94DRAFT_278224 [Lactarius quietus]|nr:hypothetical protein EI94DRAFT_278224 [Lactarius quietus]